MSRFSIHRLKTQSGVALLTAILGALLVSLTAATAIGITWRRFELAAMRTDRNVSFATAESGLQYAFARLDFDPAFRTTIRDRRMGQGGAPILYDPFDVRWRGATYVLRCHPFPPPADGDPPNPPIDQTLLALHMYTEGSPPYPANSGKHVTVRIRFLLPQDRTFSGDVPDPARPYEVRGESPKR